jgi:hypothetical protein
MKKGTKRILIAAAVVVGLGAILLGIHMLVNGVDLAGALRSMHGSR